MYIYTSPTTTHTHTYTHCILITDTGSRFSPENIIDQYTGLLQRIATKTFEIGQMRSVLDSVLHDAHVFRGSRHTASSKKLMDERKKCVQKMISECKEKAKVVRAKNRASRHGTRKVDPILGQKVLLPGHRWNLPGYYAGVVTRRGKFVPRGERKKRTTGYCVKYVEDSVTEWWKIEDLEQYFVSGEMTAATNADLKDFKMQDRVYAAWESGDEWYYGTIEKINHTPGPDSVQTYKVRFDDGTSESDVLSENIQFISRADDIDTDTTDSITGNTDVDDHDVIHLLDPLGENDNVDDVEIQEIWES